MIALQIPNITVLATTDIDTETGLWRIFVFGDASSTCQHVALVKGNYGGEDATLVRIHSECLTGDVFGSKHCDCGNQLGIAMRMIHTERSGVLLYLRQEGRGIGLVKKIQAYALQRTKGLDTVEANHALGFPDDARTYDIAAAMLHHLHVSRIRLLTNNIKKQTDLAHHGIEVVARVPIETMPNGINNGYLKIKKEKMGHLLNIEY